MSPVLTPAALSFSITSRTISKEEWAFGLAVGNDLDADDVAGLEEVLPGLHGVGGAGQLFHSFIKRGPDGGRVASTLVAHRRMAHLDDLAGKKPRRRQLGERLDVATMMRRAAGNRLGFRTGERRARRHDWNRSRRSTQELPARKACEPTLLLHGATPPRSGSRVNLLPHICNTVQNPRSCSGCPAEKTGEAGAFRREARWTARSRSAPL